ncbi:hypothetical protein Psyc_0643 [Psychrobacter arcticus 273-4]|uniref:Uncharacterized protein n=1 Tax=Psychrobacter arcticus (strain DSM 17307 / VKM B-2377 / 273-4) TaxID=259536 RepID=Q4FU06_PSYA2|nr:DUF6044 family protein [Psychrobacter arcticus]AAZ18502.1 hypothetical protein Psyc_0643 [Psychrobacter arcticus 273-4]
MKNRTSLIAYIISITILILYFYLNYNNLYIEIHDNLDQHFGWYKLLSDNNAWFAESNEVIPHMGGTSRGLYLPETQLVNIIFMIFTPLLAHCILIIIKFTIGYFSFIALSNYIFSEKNIPNIYISLIAISFALTSGNENLYIAQASIPLILYLYLKYINEKKLIILTSIFLYPILSELTRFGMFILIFMSMHFLYLLYHKDQKVRYNIISIITLSIGYLIIEYRLILSTVLSSEDTIRKTMLVSADGNFFKVLISSILNGQYHFSIHTYIFIPFLLYLLYLKIKEKVSIPKEMYLLAAIIIFNYFIYTIYTVTNINYIFWDIVTPLSGWNFSRFIWFNPFFWHLLILSLLAYTHRKANRHVIIVFLTLQILFTISYPRYGNDFYQTIKCNYFTTCENNLSYNEFYSIDFFNNLKKEIAYKENERVIAFGIHPSIIAYNGMFTMDGYHNAYYQSYKNKFRRLIKPGLEKSEKYTAYFDNWGGRAYIFSEESNYAPHRTQNQTPVELPIDFQVAKDMRIKYVISNDPIIANENLELKGTYTSPKAPYKIRVYEIVD